MNVRVLFFSAIKNALQRDVLALDVPIGSTVGELFTRLRAQHPVLEPWRHAVCLAVNAAYVKETAILHDGDEVAIIPPVAGG